MTKSKITHDKQLALGMNLTMTLSVEHPNAVEHMSIFQLPPTQKFQKS